MNSVIQQHLTNQDEIIKNIAKNIPFPKINSTQNVFHDLMSCIIEQQIHYRSTKKIFQKMMEVAELEELTIQNFHEFGKKVFINNKLSLQKFETINRVVKFFEENEIDWLPKKDDEIRKILSSIKGTGGFRRFETV